MLMLLHRHIDEPTPPEVFSTMAHLMHSCDITKEEKFKQERFDATESLFKWTLTNSKEDIWAMTGHCSDVLEELGYPLDVLDTIGDI